MTDDDPNAQRIANASRALETYERSAFPGSHSALPDRTYAQALLGAMLCDLEHYAVSHGVDFAEAIAAGRETYTDEIAAQARYQVGDQVQLRLIPKRRGTVIDVGTGLDDEPVYLVRVPGLPYVHEERAVGLESAPPFPPTPVGPNTITSAEHAQSTLVDLAARERALLSRVERRDYEHILQSLSDWSGSTSHDLLQDLRSRISQRADELRAEEITRTVSDGTAAADVAAEDFPVDIGSGIPLPIDDSRTGRPDRVPSQAIRRHHTT